MVVRYMVLGLLRDGAPTHGYALVKAYRERSGSQINSGNFYRELRRLVADGSVRLLNTDSQPDPRRRQVEITPAGRRELDAWFAGLSDPPAPDGQDDLTLRTMFIASIEPAMARRLLARWRDGLWLQSKVLERARDAAAEAGEDNGFALRRSVIARRLRHVVADLDFLEELQTALGPRLSGTEPAAAGPPASAVAPAVAAKRSGRRR
ncbi:PadR family transcriptional regulator [Candidatus Binatia bacterium]|nr:PadR family transcriptional regulator [Candidatus Binatia bacterium]